MTISRLADLPQFTLCDRDGDIRGWKLLDRDGHKIGIIEDLIVDTEACAVREVVLYINETHKDVRIPIGALALDDHHQPATTQASHDEVLAMPEIKEWHSRERKLLRATFFPQLAVAPLLGELELDDEFFRSKEPRVNRMEHTLWSYRDRT
jgi:hypothetical protein